MPKTKSLKLVLDQGAIESKFFEDTELFVINSSLPNYRFIWYMQQNLPLSFKRDIQSDIQMNEHVFPVFIATDTIRNIDHYLYTNRVLENCLLKEINKVDYIWLIRNARFHEGYIGQFLEVMREAKWVQSIFKIDPTRLSNKHLMVL